jgi:hypothetical protein
MRAFIPIKAVHNVRPGLRSAGRGNAFRLAGAGDRFLATGRRHVRRQLIVTGRLSLLL